MIDIVIGIALLPDLRFLVIKRANQEGSLLWTFPSGKIEKGESKTAAALREVQEETGHVFATATLYRVEKDIERSVCKHYMLCQLHIGCVREVHDLGVAEVRVVSLEEAEALFTTPIQYDVRNYLSTITTKNPV